MSRRPRYNRWAAGWLLGLLVVALLADFVANDRPLVASLEGEVRFPVLHDYGQQLGLVSPYQPAVRNWYRAQTDWALWPPVPYAAGNTDLKNANYKSPFAEQRTGERARHYLGTDKLGRDVLAGLIAGTRVALFVGLGAVGIAFLLGVPLGAVAGYFGNDRLRRTRAHWWGYAVGGGLGAVYGLISLRPFLGWEGWLGTTLLTVGSGLLLGFLASRLLALVPALRRPAALAADTLVLQAVEVFVNIPGLVLLIALLALIDRASLGVVVVVIGVLTWPTVARYLRGELLRVRSLPYVDAARSGGVGEWRVLFRHALPNAWGPLLVVASFGVGSAILLEAALSFLGIGIPADQVTWGSLLRQSRNQPAAWWLAIFPGLLLTATVLAANLLGRRR